MIVTLETMSEHTNYEKFLDILIRTQCAIAAHRLAIMLAGLKKVMQGFERVIWNNADSDTSDEKMSISIENKYGHVVKLRIYSLDNWSLYSSYKNDCVTRFPDQKFTLEDAFDHVAHADQAYRNALKEICKCPEHCPKS